MYQEKLAEVLHGREFLSGSSLLQLLGSFIRNTSCESILRSRAMMICGRLLSKSDDFMFNEESSIISILSAIDARMDLPGPLNIDECESALEAVGKIGSSARGAMLLLSKSSSVARKVIQASFDKQIHGRQLAALHALASILGATRKEENLLLMDEAEESLRQLVYDTASQSSKLTPSGLLFSVLHQDSEIRLAGYMVITGLSVRLWFLMEIFSKPEIIDIVTDSDRESTKICMEGRHGCCEAILKAISSLTSHSSFTGIATKLQEAVRNGPYVSLKRVRPIPAVGWVRRH